MSRGSFHAAASAAVVSAVLFSLGAILLAVARGIEQGHGGIGLMTWELPERKTVLVNVTVPEPELVAKDFVPYFDYTGVNVVYGTVGPVKTVGTTQSFAYHLSGVDPACASGPGAAPNSCGIHIHAGKSCASDAGGHFFLSATTDPWANVAYTAEAHDRATRGACR